MSLLVLAVVLFELALLGWVLATFFADRRGLARFVGVAHEPDRLKELAMQLPIEYRPIATQFSGEIARKGPLDELIVQAMTQAANTTFGLPLFARLVFGTVASILVLSPLASELFNTALSMHTLSGSGARAFMEGKK